MCSGSESKYQDAGSWVAEAGDWFRPIGLVAVGAAAGLSDAAAVVAEAGATVAGGDGLTDLLEDWNRN
jgi:hypothetical protein